MSRLKHFVQGIVSGLTPYRIQKQWPVPTLDGVKLLMGYYRASGRPITLVQIGAADGTDYDPIHEFIRQGKVNALLVEPMPISFEKLQKKYAGNSQITLVQAAIAHSDGEARMYRCRPEKLQLNWAQLTSFRKRHLLDHGVPSECIEEIVVPALTLATLLKKHKLEHVDLLQIDAEGFDPEIVKMALSLPLLPQAINFEKYHLTTRDVKELYGLLAQKNYRFIHDEYNSLAIQTRLERQLSGGID